MSQQLIEAIGLRLVQGLWSELAGLWESWLRLFSWLAALNERAFGSLTVPLAVWFVLLLLLAGRTFYAPLFRTRLRAQGPIGGVR